MSRLVGIVGDWPTEVLGRSVRGMAEALEYSEESTFDLYLRDGVALGRVSLGLLSPAPQPIWNENGSLAIFMEGEVYDYEDEKQRLIERGHRFLVDSDGEYVLHLYEEYGEDFALKLNGAFVAAIWDVAEHRLLIVNDRFGLRHFFYAYHSGRLLFAAAAHAILASGAFGPSVDAAAVAQMFAFRHAVGDRTLLEGIRLLPPASLLFYRGEERILTLSRYWDFQYVEEYPDRSEESYLDGWIDHMHQAVERRMRDDGPVGVQLSGGIDSRTVLAMMDRRHYPVHTFTFGVPGAHDARYAREVARRLGTHHHFFELKPDHLASFIREGIRLTDGAQNCVYMHVALTLPQIAEHVRLLYTGSLGDSIMGSTLNRLLLSAYGADVQEQVLFRMVNALVPLSEFPHFFSDAFYQAIKDVPFESFRSTMAASHATLPANQYDYFRIREYERRSVLNGPRMLRSRVVCRMPFYDNDFVDFMLRVPPALRLERYLYHRAFARAFPDLARIPNTSNPGDLLPLVACRRELMLRAEALLRRRLRAAGLKWVAPPGRCWYTDCGGWMRGSLRHLVERTLLSGRAVHRGYFNPVYVRNLVEEHMSGRADHTEHIGALLTFELWHRMFLD